MKRFQVSVTVTPPGRYPQHAEFGCDTAEEAIALRDWLLAGNGVAVIAYAPDITEVTFGEGRRASIVGSRTIQSHREL